MSADGGTLHEPPLEEQPDGGCLQSGERILYAGDKAFGKRVLGQSADPILLPQEMEQGVDKRGESFPCGLRLRNAGQR